MGFLAATKKFGVTKTEGLLARVLEYVGISGEDMVYEGDSVERDVEPAMGEGIFSIHFTEGVLFV